MIPTVSIIIPCYNQGDFLPDAIDSLMKQTFIHWECIIVNDGSFDNTAEIAEKLALIDSRIKVINQKNKGLSGARNTGLRNSTGEMVQFLDADDRLEQDKIKSQVEFLNANPDIDIVFGDARYFKTGQLEAREFGINTNESWIPERWKAPGNLVEKLLKNNLFPVNCPLVRSSVFNTIGQWNEDLEAHEDWEYWLRCAILNKKIFYWNSPDSLALIRMHPESMTNNISRMQLSNIKMRIAIGSSLNYPFRLINIKNGLHILQNANPPDLINQFFKLSLANITPKVLLYVLHYLTFLFYRKLLTIYKKRAPWPIQKFLLKLFRSYEVVKK